MDRSIGPDNVAEFLAHYGVKGMKWGVRKKRPLTPQQIKRADHKFERRARKSRTQVQIYNQAISDFKHAPALKAINNKPKYSETRRFKYGLTTNRKLYKEYNNEVATAFLGHLDSKARQQTNASGTREYRAVRRQPKRVVDESKNRWKVITGPVRHAEESFEVDVIRDEFGFILDFKMVETDIEQSDVTEFFAHYGVKGMRWGVKKGRKPKPEPSLDGVRAAIIKSKAKSGGKKALSNEELRVAIERMNLEQNFHRLRVNERNPVSRYMSSLLLEVGKQQVSSIAREEAAKALRRRVKS